MNESTEKRGFDVLMDAISLRDNGNVDVILVVSMESGSAFRGRSRFQGTIGDPPGIIGRARQIVENASLNEIKRKEDKKDSERNIFKSGTRIILGGRGVKFQISRQWKPNKSPKKREVHSELERMFKYQIPKKLRVKRAGPLNEAKEWINEVPEAGTDKTTHIRIRFPDIETEIRDRDSKEEREYWIEIQVVETSSLSGVPPKLEDDGSKLLSKN